MGAGREEGESRRRQFRTIKIPAPLAQALDDWLKTDEATIQGLYSRADVITKLASEFLHRRRGGQEGRLSVEGPR